MTVPGPAPVAVVVGAGGQDGSLLCEALLRRGRRVVGVSRRRGHAPPDGTPGFSFRPLDVADARALHDIVAGVRPQALFYAAAVHGPAGFPYEESWDTLFAVNCTGLLACLEASRRASPATRVVYFNSSKILGAPLSGVVSEATPHRGACLYSATKTAALRTVAHYRDRHGIAACNLILFNHESDRRPPGYLIPALAEGIAGRLRGRGRRRIRTLDFHGDWSCAAEVAEIAADAADAGLAADVLVASGRTVYGWDLAAEACARFSLAVEECFELDDPTRRDPAPPPFRVDVASLRAAVGRAPERSVVDVVAGMARTMAEDAAASAR